MPTLVAVGMREGVVMSMKRNASTLAFAAAATLVAGLTSACERNDLPGPHSGADNGEHPSAGTTTIPAASASSGDAGEAPTQNGATAGFRGSAAPNDKPDSGLPPVPPLSTLGTSVPSAPPPTPQAAFDGGNPPSEVDTGVPSPDIEHVSVPANGFTFEVLVSGPTDGESVLLLHGFGAYSLSWISQINAFATAGYRVVAPDLRGYSPGARPADLLDYLLPFFADDIVAIADHFGFVRFHLVGHDVGSAVGWITAVTAPDRIASFAALSVPHPNAVASQFWDPDSCQTQASSYVDRFTADNAEEMFLANDAANLRKLWTDTEVLGDEILSPKEVDDRVAFYRTEGTLTGGLNWYRANTPFRWLAVVPAVSVPVLFVWGDDDFSICRESAESNRDYVTGPYRFEVFAGYGHWLPEFGGARLNELLLEHVRAYPVAR